MDSESQFTRFCPRVPHAITFISIMSDIVTYCLLYDFWGEKNALFCLGTPESLSKTWPYWLWRTYTILNVRIDYRSQLSLDIRAVMQENATNLLVGATADDCTIIRSQPIILPPKYKSTAGNKSKYEGVEDILPTIKKKKCPLPLPFSTLATLKHGQALLQSALAS